MLNIGVLGGPEFVLGFQLAGVKKTFEATTDSKKTAEEALADPDIGILIVDDHLLQSLDERVRENIVASLKPVCIPLSAEAGAQDALRKMIQKSIGIDLWKE